MLKRRWLVFAGLFFLVIIAVLALTGFRYLGLFRPGVIAQLDPEIMTLLNELPNLDEPNEALVGRIFATGGGSRPTIGSDGVMRDRVRIPKDEYLWYPAAIIMPHGGVLELDITNEDQRLHAIYVPSNGDRKIMMLPAGTRGVVRVELDAPGWYWFGCPVENHVGRGMLGIVIVKGEVPPEARLDRPPQPQAGNRRPPGAHAH